MMKHDRSEGDGEARTYSDVEVGILADLGYTVTPIPEPTTWAMMLAGLGGLAASACSLKSAPVNKDCPRPRSTLRRPMLFWPLDLASLASACMASDMTKPAPPPATITVQESPGHGLPLRLPKLSGGGQAMPARSSYFVKPDGSVGRQWLKMADATSYRLCFLLPAYERCVEFRDGDAPPELQALVQRLLADAELQKLSQAR